MLLVAVALLSAIATMHFAIHGAEVQVPALQGMTVADARSQTAGLGLNLDVDNRYYSGDVAAGHILTQSPAAGTVVRREWRVRVAESLGPQKVDVPDTVGKDERVAALTLRRVGLEVGTTAQLPWSKCAGGHGAGAGPARPCAGNFAAQREPAGGRRSDEAADGFVMPDLVGFAGGDRAGAVGQGGHSVAGLRLMWQCPCAGGQRRCAMPKAPVKPGIGDCADARRWFSRVSECDGHVDGGTVSRC
jgi:hypothetical protein